MCVGFLYTLTVSVTSSLRITSGSRKGSVFLPSLKVDCMFSVKRAHWHSTYSSSSSKANYMFSVKGAHWHSTCSSPSRKEEKRLPFLDPLVILKDDATLTVKVYRKPTHLADPQFLYMYLTYRRYQRDSKGYSGPMEYRRTANHSVPYAHCWLTPRTRPTIQTVWGCLLLVVWTVQCSVHWRNSTGF